MFIGMEKEEEIVSKNKLLICSIMFIFYRSEDISVYELKFIVVL